MTLIRANRSRDSTRNTAGRMRRSKTRVTGEYRARPFKINVGLPFYRSGWSRRCHEFNGLDPVTKLCLEPPSNAERSWANLRYPGSVGFSEPVFLSCYRLPECTGS